jgi:uncharacterized protein HemX
MVTVPAGWSQWWAEISKYFQIDFNADDNVRPLLAGQQLNQLRLALSLTIEQAQWAALNGDAKVYTQALDDARSVLLANFNPTTRKARPCSTASMRWPISPCPWLPRPQRKPGGGAGLHSAASSAGRG